MGFQEVLERMSERDRDFTFPTLTMLQSGCIILKLGHKKFSPKPMHCLTGQSYTIMLQLRVEQNILQTNVPVVRKPGLFYNNVTALLVGFQQC